MKEKKIVKNLGLRKKMHSKIWLSLFVLCSLISGYYTQMVRETHYVSDDDDDDIATLEPPNPNKGIEDTDGYCIYEEK